jgi:hypothetical protein
MLFTLVLAAVLLVLAFRGVDWQQMLATLRQGRLDYLALTFACLTTAFFLRGLRWRVLLSAERPVSPLDTFWATSVGYLGNGFLPARAGELIRSAMLGRRAGISASYVLATALTERILDALFLVLIGLLAMLTLEGLPPWLITGVQIMAVLGMASLGGLVLLPRLERFFLRMLAALPLPAALHTRLAEMLEQFLFGMRAFQRPASALSFAALTLVIWCVDAVYTVGIALALGLSLSLPQAFLVLAALGLSSAVPSTPGYVGVYQFVAVTVLPLFGFLQSEALAYIIMFQAVTYLVILLWGLLGLWRLGLAKEKL